MEKKCLVDRIVLLKGLGITAIIALLFYRSVVAGIWFPVVYMFCLRQEKRKKIQVARMKLQEEFLHGIGVLNSSIQAGFSMENAWREVEKETRFLYGEKSKFYLELKEMNQKAAHNTPFEKLFLEFAYRSKLEEIIQFAELLNFGKRSGSDWKRIIDVTVCQMTEQRDAQQQIEVMVAEKKMEQQIMNLMPLGILAFLQFSAWDYMCVLYHNWLGGIAMTFFLFLYVVSIVLSQKIMKVEV